MAGNHNCTQLFTYICSQEACTDFRLYPKDGNNGYLPTVALQNSRIVGVRVCVRAYVRAYACVGVCARVCASLCACACLCLCVRRPLSKCAFFTSVLNNILILQRISSVSFSRGVICCKP